MTLFVQFVRARQLKAQSVQRSLEEVAVRQIEIEKESVEIGKLPKSHPHLHPSLTPVYPQLNPIFTLSYQKSRKIDSVGSVEFE